MQLAKASTGIAALCHQRDLERDARAPFRIAGEIAVHCSAGIDTLYAEHCASCHGANLEGQHDWRERLPSGRMPAPPHDASGHTWHHSDEALFRVTRESSAAVAGGGYESDMPGFGDVMTDDQIRAVLAFIKSTWPERIRNAQGQKSAMKQKTSQ